MKDAEFYRDMLSSRSFPGEMLEEEAVDVCLAAFTSHKADIKTPCEVLFACNLPRNATKLYHALHMLLAVEKIAFEDRLEIHMFLARTEHSDQDRAYHTDIIIELITRAKKIPSGPKMKHNMVINQVVETANLQNYLADAHEVLHAHNKGQKLNVCWNRLSRGGEAQHLYMDNSGYTEPEPVASVISEPMDVDDANVRNLARDMARLSVE